MKKLLLLTGFSFVVGIALASAAYYFTSTRDEAPPKDDDLRLARVEISDEENAFGLLEQAAEKVYWPEEEPKEEQLYKILAGETWDSQLVDELIEKNQESLRLLEIGLARIDLRIPPISGIDYEAGYLYGWTRLGQTCALRATWLFKRGQEKEAFDQAMKLVRFGNMVEGCGGSLIHGWVGVALKGIGLGRLRSIVKETTLEADSVSPYVRALAEYAVDEQALADCLRVEYMVAAGIIDDLVSGKQKPEALFDDVSAEAARSLLGKYHFQANRTKRMFAETYRPAIENLTRNYGEMKPYEEVSYPHGLSLYKDMLCGNSAGKMLYAFVMPALGRTEITKCSESVFLAATRLLLALKCYKLEKGRLPESLEELVPAYIEKVPLDDFDGQPMRYSREKKIIYSVGEDLKDSGGSEEPEGRDEKEPTFGIEF